MFRYPLHVLSADAARRFADAYVEQLNAVARSSSEAPPHRLRWVIDQRSDSRSCAAADRILWPRVHVAAT